MTIGFDAYEWKHVADAIGGDDALKEIMDEYAYHVSGFTWKEMIEIIAEDAESYGIYDDAALDFYNLVRTMWKAYRPQDFVFYETPWNDDEDIEETVEIADIIWRSLGD